MKVKTIIAFFFVFVFIFTHSSCNIREKTQKLIEPQVSQMKSICELATMDCYYNNVAKYREDDVEGILFWKKDKRFWIEYSGIVKVGIDASLIDIEVNEDIVTITIPEAKVLGSEVDEQSLNEDSFIVDKDSVNISGEDQIKALSEAQKHMLMTASGDSTLLSSAQQRAQILLEKYIENIGKVIGKEYSIKWLYLDSNDSDLTSTNIG